MSEREAHCNDGCMFLRGKKEKKIKEKIRPALICSETKPHQQRKENKQNKTKQQKTNKQKNKKTLKYVDILRW